MLQIALPARVRWQDRAPSGPAEAVGPDEQLVLLMGRYERPLYNYAVTILRDEDVAMDCVQDTFVRAYDHLCKGRTINRNWLFTVSRNRAMDEFRRRKRVEPKLDALENVPVFQSLESAIDLQRIFDQLSTTDREVLFLHAVAGFRTDEIGEMLRLRGSAVRQRLYRAREHFRHLYSGAL
jgi:RNA polymerase sigma-70 factor (ECF subfamily)